MVAIPLTEVPPITLMSEILGIANTSGVKAVGRMGFATFATQILNEIQDNLTFDSSILQSQLDVLSTSSSYFTIHVATAETNIAVLQASVSALNSATASGKFTYADTAAGLSKGVAGFASLVGGTGGTNGTFDIAFSGGAGTGAAGRFTVVGGIVTSILITSPGVNYTTAPTMSFAASAGLTGASATSVIAYRNNVGDYFNVPVSASDDGIITYRVDAGPVATEIMRLPSATLVSNYLSQNVVGNTPTNAGTANATTNYYFWPLSLKTYAQVCSTLEIAAGSACSQTIVVAFVEAGGQLTFISERQVSLTLGSNTLNGLDILIPAGCVIGIGGTAGILYDSGGSLSYWYTTVKPASSTAKTAVTANPSRHRFTMRALARDAAENFYALEQKVGGAQAIGWPTPIVTTGSNAPSYTIIDRRAARGDGVISSFQVAVNSPTNVTIAAVSMAGLVMTIVNQQTFAVAVGAPTVNCNIPIAKGQYLAVMAANIKYQPSANTDGVGYWYYAGVGITGTTVINTPSHRFEFAATILWGMNAFGAVVTNDNLGMNLLIGADTTGVSDATAIFATARASHANPYVKPGRFALSSIPQNGDGFYGPGKIILNGDQFFIPEAPMLGSLYDGLRSALADNIFSNDVLTLIGDSIGHFAYAPTGGEHFFNALTRFANYDIAKDEPIMTALRPSSSYVPDFYGVILSGTAVSTGTAGPLGESLIMAAGSIMTFTGAYEQVDVFYKRESGAGSLAFQYNGGAAFHTVNANGATDLDRHSAAPATGQTASGTYTITCSGAPVEITGLIRLGVKSATIQKNRLRTMRAAHGSYSLASFGSTQVTSIAKQAAYAGGKCIPIIELGINDSFSQTYATIKTRAQALIAALNAAGVGQIFGIIPFRPNPNSASGYTSPASYDAMAAALRSIYRANGVKIIALDAIDFYSTGLTADTVHPSGLLGQQTYAQCIVEALVQYGRSS